MKKYVGIFLVAGLGAAAGIGFTKLFDKEADKVVEVITPATAQLTNLTTSTGATLVENPDFIHASAIATPAVVHIKSTVQLSQQSDPWSGFFGNPYHSGRKAQSSGSGVIISADGYIATNNHVVDGATTVEVVLNDKRSFEAKVIGTDPTTDLALIKIEENALPFLSMGNSEQVQVGEWALAVGNPFNLTSTVTAGIVSAKGRNLNLLEEQFAIESFIQTDAAVNPGNSGGALVNTSGELIGINTAIASETGSYAGYSFAIPVNIVRKVMKDLKEFGEVQRGIIGVQIGNITSELAKQKNLKTLNGALVGGIIPGGAAQEAGLKAGDIITRVNETAINSSAELQEIIGTFRPGDRVNLVVNRDGENLKVPVTLRNKNGTTDLVVSQNDAEDAPGQAQGLGIRMEKLSNAEKQLLELPYGVKVASVGRGVLQEVGIEKGFIITRVNKQPVSDPKEVERLIEETDGSVLIEGVNPDGRRQYFAFEY